MPDIANCTPVSKTAAEICGIAMPQISDHVSQKDHSMHIFPVYCSGRLCYLLLRKPRDEIGWIKHELSTINGWVINKLNKTI